MSFTEIIFAPFLFSTFFFFFLTRKYPRIQIIVLLAASYVFYGWWNANFLLLIIFSSLLDFAMGHMIHRSSIPSKKKIYLSFSLVGNLGLLAYFKYTNFFIDSLSMAIELMGYKPHLPTLNIVLPVGISFYTFQSLSYSLDIYFAKIKPEKSLINFLFFVAAFPQLVAGPIVRAKDFLPQLKVNLYEQSDEEGVFYILYGLIKKICIADLLGYYLVDSVFADPQSHSSLELLIGVYAYAYQIFFDFSAYSDIAIGLGKIFGLKIPVNFRSPYCSCNPTEFWRRWHITLSTWLRDYLYIPLGGNRVSQGRYVGNLMIVMLLGGLWHGSNWTFIFWGGLHGLYLVLYKLLSSANSQAEPKYNILKNVLFFHLVCITWIFFRSPNIGSSFTYIAGLCGSDFSLTYVSGMYACLLIGSSIVIHHWVEPNIIRIARIFTGWHWSIRSLLIFGFLIFISFITEKGIAHQAFIYFQF